MLVSGEQIRLATRGSELALSQVREVAEALHRLYPALDVKTHVVRTTGDLEQSRSIKSFGSRGIFVKEIDEALLTGSADAGVHSVKDIPASGMTKGLRIVAVLPRPSYVDYLVSKTPLDSLHGGARVGTSSVRRTAQLKNYRRDLIVAGLRGNVTTRLGKWRRGDYDAIVLSKAGLMRLGLSEPGHDLDPSVFVPEAGQGTVAVVCRKDSREEKLLSALDDRPTRLEIEVEREVLARLGGGCSVPVGVHASYRGGEIATLVQILSPDGTESYKEERVLALGQHLEGAAELAKDLLRRAGGRILRQFS